MLLTMNAHDINADLLTALRSMLSVAKAYVPKSIQEDPTHLYGVAYRGASEIATRAERAQLQQKRAAIVPGAIRVLSSGEIHGTLYVEVECLDDYDTFKTLPDVIEVDGRQVGKSAFNSDRHVAYYRSDVPLATVRKEAR